MPRSRLYTPLLALIRFLQETYGYQGCQGVPVMSVHESEAILGRVSNLAPVLIPVNDIRSSHSILHDRP